MTAIGGMEVQDGQGAAEIFSRGYLGQDWSYPAPRWDQPGAVTAPAVAAHTGSGAELSPTGLTGTPALLLDDVLAIRLGGTSATNADENQELRITCAAQVQLAKLPTSCRLEEHRRIHWWSCRLRFSGANATFGLRNGIGLLGNQTGTNFFGSETTPTLGHGLCIVGDGAGALRLVAKVSASANAALSRTFALTWPRAISLWTEVWFVILSATATRAARFRCYVDRAQVAEWDWPDDGVTGSLNPTLETGATAFRWVASMAGGVNAGMRLWFTGWRYRQGLYDVDGSELNGL